jgi:hypothetical protein
VGDINTETWSSRLEEGKISAKSKEVKTGWHIWQNLLRKVIAQKGLSSSSSMIRNTRKSHAIHKKKRLGEEKPNENISQLKCRAS